MKDTICLVIMLLQLMMIGSLIFKGVKAFLMPYQSLVTFQIS